jgi:formylglycine-generating enzyme required for sulfatase activity
VLAACSPSEAGEPKVYTQWPFDAAEARRRQAETAKALGVEVERDIELAAGVKMRLVLIPAGEFLMGSSISAAEVTRLAGRPVGLATHFAGEHPQHRVRITRPFWMGKCEVTQAQWQAVMGTHSSRYNGAQNPVDSVSWHDVQGFLQKVNGRLRGETVALPTDAQWEYACRAGTATAFHFGDTISTEHANYNGNQPYRNGPKGVYRRKTVPVGSFPPNAWGLHDMHGNVYEWCADWFDEKYYERSPTDDPHGAAAGRYRVLRGGCWDNHAWGCRSAYRSNETPTFWYAFLGCRVVLPVKSSR